MEQQYLLKPTKHNNKTPKAQLSIHIIKTQFPHEFCSQAYPLCCASWSKHVLFQDLPVFQSKLMLNPTTPNQTH